MEAELTEVIEEAAEEEPAAKEERATVAEVSIDPAELSPSIERRSHPAQSGETFDGPPSLERSGSEHREGAVTSPLPEVSVPRKRGNRRGCKDH